MIDTLIERLEAAECGSHQLDREMWSLLGLRFEPCGGGASQWCHTTSLDAITSLISEKLPRMHRLSGHAGDAFPGLFNCLLMPPGHGLDFSVRAKTEPLACCIAFLKAWKGARP